MMELFIETLTGTAFELRVSPFETIMSVKAKIARLEGIPISQQHLVWQSRELEDDFCLQDYSIHDGATLKLVLAMRGGPINTRRVPTEDPAFREISELIASETSRDDLVEKSPNRGQVTLVVFREGDQLNFFRVVDRGDGNYSPLSESLSGASVYNLGDEDEEEEVLPRERVAENDKTKEKMKLLKMKMDNLSINKKPKKKHVPHPPSRPGSKVRLRCLPGSSTKPRTISLNRNPCLPPLRPTSVKAESPRQEVEEAESVPQQLSAVCGATAAVETVKGLQAVTEVTESDLSIRSGSRGAIVEPSASRRDSVSAKRSGSQYHISSASRDKDIDYSVSDIKTPLQRSEYMAEPPLLPSPPSSQKPDLTYESMREGHKPSTSSIGRKESREPGRPSTSSRKEVTFETLKESLGHAGNSKYTDRVEFTLESLSQKEARAVSGMLRQASIERLGSSRLSTFIRSASRSRAGFSVNSTGMNDGRISTPEGRLVSARLQKLSNGRDDRVMTPSHRLPPVKPKKKSKKCFVCGKKTSLVASYMCRCGNNFCATHRLPELHECTFDYKSEGRKLLEQSNPVVTAPKLPKI